MVGKLNDRQRRFAEFVVSGMSAAAAFREAGYKARGQFAEQAASRLLSNAVVSAYLEGLRARTSEDFRLSRNDLLNFLSAIIETPIGEMTPDHPLCQVYDVRKNAAGETVWKKVVMASKLRAAHLICKICGYYEPEQREHRSTTLEEALADFVKRRNEAEPVESEIEDPLPIIHALPAPLDSRHFLAGGRDCRDSAAA